MESHNTRVLSLNNVSAIRGPSYLGLCECGWEGYWRRSDMAAQADCDAHIVIELEAANG